MTSGLSAADYVEIARATETNNLGVVAAGNFSLTAALAKHFALLAAKHLPSWEVIDYAKAGKPDAPSGSALELAEALGEVATNTVAVPVGETRGHPAAVAVLEPAFVGAVPRLSAAARGLHLGPVSQFREHPGRARRRPPKL